MTCPKCGSENVNVQMVQDSAKSKHNGRGIIWKFCRLLLIICTCGLWLIVGKSKGKTKTKIKNKSVCVCQSCGHSWDA